MAPVRKSRHPRNENLALEWSGVKPALMKPWLPGALKLQGELAVRASRKLLPRPTAQPAATAVSSSQQASPVSLPSFAIKVNLPAPAITGTPNGTATVSVPHSFTPTANNATSFVPPGLSFDSSNGLSSVPQAAWTYAMVITVNSVGIGHCPPSPLPWHSRRRPLPPPAGRWTPALALT